MVNIFSSENHRTFYILPQNNNFASGHLFLKGKGQSFSLENALILTPELLYDNFILKVLLNFLVKIVMQKNSLACMHDGSFLSF